MLEIVDSQAVKKNGAKYRLKKTEKSFSPLVCAMDDKFYSFMNALQRSRWRKKVNQLLPRGGQAS